MECFDASFRNFLGPIGVSDEYRRSHIGKELLLYALYGMKEEGYGYAIIGWCEEKNKLFYEKSADTIIIPNLFPGVYKDSILLSK